ncbi:hypothetical protein EDB19DRAFT_1828152 [Suillus lakei]|nr:hypothetical protein EDB19DRAFT_1828152 [Suillus lakei]
MCSLELGMKAEVGGSLTFEQHQKLEGVRYSELWVHSTQNMLKVLLNCLLAGQTTGAGEKILVDKHLGVAASRTYSDWGQKLHTKAQKAADEQREEEEKKASKAAVLETNKRVATFHKKMETDQAAACADAPKPSCLHPHPVKKAVKDPETTNLTMAANKAVGAIGNGGRADKSAASANIEHPGSEEDEELEVQMPGAHKKKEKRMMIPAKTPVRDVIDVAGALIANESTQACDDDKLSDLDV